MSPTHRPSILLVGDSLTQQAINPERNGFMTLLQNHYIRKVDFINRGLSGYNTRWYIEAAIPSLVADFENGFKPILITIWLGANDASLIDGECARQAVPVEEYKENLHTMVKLFTEYIPNVNILLFSPPPVDESVRLQRSDLCPKKLDRSNNSVVKYAEACKDLATQYANVVFVDIFTTFMKLDEVTRSSLFYDGLHFTSNGNRQVFQLILGAIQEHFPTLTADALPLDAPLHTHWK